MSVRTSAAASIADVVPAVVSGRSAPDADFQLTPSTTIVAAGAAEAAGTYLAEVLRPATGYPLPVVPRESPDGGIVLVLGGADPRVGAAGYQLVVDRRRVVLRAATAAGLFAGVQTLRQLLPATVESRQQQPGPWTVCGGEILDYPRFAHRGAMLDVARHFFTVEEVKRHIDLIAQYKINVLHLHLTDDQGWRLEITSWPRLATHGGGTQVGGGPGGYYTQREYQDLVAYAAARHVTIIPEIDIPGHSNAALSAYAELTCDGEAPPPFTTSGTAVGFSSLCVDNDSTYRFVDDVLEELSALTPGGRVHIGADEADVTPPEGYRKFVHRALAIAAGHGLEVTGWHEVLRADPPPATVVQYWGTSGVDNLVAAATARGTEIVLSPASRAYLDMKYHRGIPIGFKWAGFIDVDEAYNWDPGSFLRDVPESAVLGVEAPLWSETLTSRDDLDFMSFPRLPAIAELGWSPRSTHDRQDFARRLARHGARWTAQGVAFYPSTQIPWPA
ncbi:family 20 glycosylhydrolase [Jiangella muralis]|uniref:family 20 glycosylhydrolase n=1 Tax=Jiangella muralis TaxID=702383 RepID=UPI0009F9963B|nr:family 20 glycosylhydrolase [Jiangella muralis]